VSVCYLSYTLIQGINLRRLVTAFSVRFMLTVTEECTWHYQDTKPESFTVSRLDI
jgi:hypothetical protein